MQNFRVHRGPWSFFDLDASALRLGKKRINVFE